MESRYRFVREEVSEADIAIIQANLRAAGRRTPFDLTIIAGPYLEGSAWLRYEVAVSRGRYPRNYRNADASMKVLEDFIPSMAKLGCFPEGLLRQTTTETVRLFHHGWRYSLHRTVAYAHLDVPASYLHERPIIRSLDAFLRWLPLEEPRVRTAKISSPTELPLHR
jgi:hypothetical protein